MSAPHQATRYYERTAADYDRWHVHEYDENFTGLRYISSLVDLLGATSLLDVGSGTGRGVRYLMAAHPNLQIVGIEPEDSLRQVALDNGVPDTVMVSGSGLALPYPDQSFDIVCELSVLHHVKTPEVVVREMMRVARRAVILVDENRFAYGSMPVRLFKLLLWKIHAFKFFYWIKTKGKGSRYSQEDGTAYSYSVFDSLPLLSQWGDRIMTIALDRNSLQPDYRVQANCVFQPLLTSFRMLLATIRDLPSRDS